MNITARSFILCIYLVLSSFSLGRGQEVMVPEYFEFAGIRLNIKPEARQEIQVRVNALRADSTKFSKQVKAADLYMPLIQDILAETGLPSDFKYLALLDNTQPDSLLFWQMATQQALNFGLAVNSEVDERLNVLATSKAIAKYLKNNHLELKNWLFTLLSYHLAPNQLTSYLQSNFSGISMPELLNMRSFDIDLFSHPDILTFLAYDFAFRPELGKNLYPAVELVSFDKTQGKTLNELAKAFSLPEAQIKAFNAWLKGSRIPADKTYEALIPMPTKSPSAEVFVSKTRGGQLIYETEEPALVHTVEPGQTLYRISIIYGVNIEDIKKWNGLSSNTLKVGQQLVLNDSKASSPTVVKPNPSTPTPDPSKVSESTIFLHTVVRGETLFALSRKYKVTVAEIKNWNDLKSNTLRLGQQLKIKVPQKETQTTPKETPKPINTNPKEGNEIGTTKPEPTTPTVKPQPSQPRTLKAKSVPSKIEMEGVTLIITEAGRELIEQDVKNLTRSEKYFFEKLNRVDVYMPLISQTLKAANIPEDFKYIPIQESALIANAVSSSRAVGYWQFKAPSATEVGMLVNNQIDERMHIIQATEGAAKYLQRSQLYFDNWLFTLLSFNMGFTGAKNYLERQYRTKNIRGMKQVQIDAQTHWYIRKFLAHKIAFEDEVGLYSPAYQLKPRPAQARQTLRQIAKEQTCQCDEGLLKVHNQWLKANAIPMDKTYSVILPLK